MATISVPQAVPSPVEDCEHLKQAFAGWGTNEKLIISILGHRNASQRNMIRKTYSELYQEDVLKELKKELSHHFESALLLWILDPAERDASLIHESVMKSESNFHVVIEVACARSPAELLRVRETYHAKFKRSIEEDIAPKTTGGLRKLLVGLVSSYRYGGHEVDRDLAKSEAKLLQEKIKGNAANHEEVIRIVTTRSKSQLKETFTIYKDQNENHIHEDLEGNTKDKYFSALRAAVMCLTAPEKYFGSILHLSMNKPGTDEDVLTRVVVTRAEVDMKLIKDEYKMRYGVGLDKAIEDDTSGDYKQLLLTLIGHGNN